MHTNPSWQVNVVTWFPVYSHPLVPHTAPPWNWLYALVSWSRPKAVLCYYPFCYSTTGTQRQKTLCLALCLVPLSLLPSFLLSFLCVTTNTHSAPCKQVLFVLPDYKYCFGKLIIKRRDGVYLSNIDTKHTELHCWKIFLLHFSFFLLLFGFSV